MADLPSITPPLATADIQSGGSLSSVSATNSIYATRGKATKDFCKYNTSLNSWICSTPTQDFPVNFGVAITTQDRGELAYLSTNKKLYGIPGASTFIYELDVNYRATIESINGGSSPVRGVPFSVIVQATDSAGNPVIMAQNTDITLSLITGTGTLGGNLTDRIRLGTSSTTISGVTYSKAESIVIRATDTSSTPTLSATNSNPFTVTEPPPVISTISPDHGTTEGKDPITISGSNFISGATVTFDSLSAEGVTFVDSSTLTVAPPQHAIGTATVIVTNPDSQYSTSSGGYTYSAPVVSSVVPPVGPPAGGTPVTINGDYFKKNYYIRQLNITNGGVLQLNNFQTSFTIDTATLISQGKMRSDCGDIRVLNPGKQNLKYWIESGCNSASTKIWVKAESLPPGAPTPHYVTYGHPSLTSKSSCTDVFLFCDDFSGSSLDTSKWSTTSGNLEGDEVSGGYLTLENTEGLFATGFTMPDLTVWETSRGSKNYQSHGRSPARHRHFCTRLCRQHDIH